MSTQAIGQSHSRFPKPYAVYASIQILGLISLGVKALNGDVTDELPTQVLVNQTIDLSGIHQ